MRQESLTPDDLDRLLQWLDLNPEQAALKYEKTRIRLITFFAAGNCGCEAERLPDEGFDRGSEKLKAGQVSESHDRDKTFYFLGFARNIRHEYHRQPKPAELTTAVVAANVNHNHDDTEQEFECLDECMDELTKENRWAITEYYYYEKSAKIEHRKKIANKLGIDVKALRLRIYRIREQLKPCIESCLDRVSIAS